MYRFALCAAQPVIPRPPGMEGNNRTIRPTTTTDMKVTTITILAAAGLGLTACDQAKDAASEAAAKTKAAAAEASAKADAAMPDLKAKAANAVDSAKAAGAEALDSAKAAGAEAMDSAKAAGSDALAKGGSMIDSAKEWGLEKMGVPEADGLLEGFGTLIGEAKAAVAGGLSGEKAAALKGKWDALYAKSTDTIKNLDPAKQEKLKAILATVKAKWDELMSKAQNGTVQ